MSDSNYIAKTTEDLFSKIDLIQKQLESFSLTVDEKRNNVTELLQQFKVDVTSDLPVPDMQNKKETNGVDVALQDALFQIQDTLTQWDAAIKIKAKGMNFMSKHEKYLVVMVFGAVKSGKSSLGNLFAGNAFRKAAFDNAYKHHATPVFETEEKGRNSGAIVRHDGEVAFAVGYTDTTGDIQYFTLSGLRWIDSPGTGALRKEGDERIMEDMVKEYIPYADICIFLMNSSEPGLQSDMKYMQFLEKQRQSAIVVITHSDVTDEDEDEDGNIIQQLVPKSPERRKRQEDDICQRLSQEYPNLSSEQYRALSVSTLLAEQAIQENDGEKFKSSNIDMLMQNIYKKVGNDIIQLKMEKPKNSLNTFVEEIINGQGDDVASIHVLLQELNTVTEEIENYQKRIDQSVNRILHAVISDVRYKVQHQSDEWSQQIYQGGTAISQSEILSQISALIWDSLDKNINSYLGKIIKDYKKQQLSRVEMNLNVGSIQKKTTVIETPYTEVYYVERDPSGLIEHVRHFFGKTYLRRVTEQKVLTKQIDIGNNAMEVLEAAWPKIEKTLEKHVHKALCQLRDTYFAPQQAYIDKIQQRLQLLEKNLLELKYKE